MDDFFVFNSNDRGTNAYGNSQLFKEAAPVQKVSLTHPKQPVDDLASDFTNKLHSVSMVHEKKREISDVSVREDVKSPSRFILKGNYEEQALSACQSAQLQPTAKYQHSPRTKSTSTTIRQGRLKSIADRFISKFHFFRRLTDDQRRIVIGLTDLRDLQVSSIPLFSKNSQFLQIWDILIFFLIIWTVIWIPLLVSFNIDRAPYLEYFSIVIFFIDIVFEVNRTLLQNGKEILDRKLILQNYLKLSFILDSAAIILLILIYEQLVAHLSWLATTYFFLKLQKLESKIYQIKGLFGIEDRFFFYLTVNIASFVILVHVMTCIWHGIGRDSDNQTWIKYMGLDQSPLLDRYLYSFYQCGSILITAETMTSHNLVETGVASGFIIITYTLLILNLTFFLSIFSNQNEYRESLKDLNQYMRQHNIPKSLARRIQRQILRVQAINDTSVKQNLQKLSLPVQEELQQVICGRILKNCQVFKHFSVALTQKLALKLKEVNIMQDSKIIDREQREQTSLFFVNEGEFYVDKIELKDSTFGLVSFFTQQERKISVTNRGYAQCLELNYADFRQLLNLHPKDLEIFAYLRDMLSFYQNYGALGMRCLGCEQTNHLFHNCPKVHFVGDKDAILKRLSFNTPQQRYIQLRSKKRGFRTRLDLVTMQLITKDYKSQKLDQDDSAEEDEVSKLPYEDQGFQSARSLTGISAKYSVNNPLEAVSSDEDVEEVNNPEFHQIFRSKEVKLTYATAGFGNEGDDRRSMKESSNPMHIIEEGDSSSSSEEERARPIQQNKQDSARHQSRKLTFNQNFDLASNYSRRSNRNNSATHKNSFINQTSIRTSRENSHRSMTYTPNPSMISQNISYKTFVNNISAGTPQHMRAKSTRSLYSQDDQNRRSQRRYSSNNTKVSKTSILPSNFSPFSGMDNPIYVNDGPYMLDFDRMHKFKIYFPKNNYDYVIKQYKIHQKNRANTCIIQRQLNAHYSFDISISQMADRFKKHLLGSHRMLSFSPK